MRKNLTIECFRGLARPNELIEIGLTHQFDSIDIDMVDMLARAAAMGKKFACQFIKSAGIPVACFDLPWDLGAEPSQFDAQLKDLDSIVDLAKEVRATRCRLEVGTTGSKVYHEQFELLRQRISELADSFAPAGVAIGLLLQRDPSIRHHEYQFIQKADELLTLIKLVGKKNVGLALDTFSWTLTGGTTAGLRKLAPSQWIDVQLCEPAPGATWATADATARSLPSPSDDSPMIEWIKYLGEIGYDGPIAVTAHPSQIGLTKPSAIGSRLAESLNDMLAKAEIAPAVVASR